MNLFSFLFFFPIVFSQTIIPNLNSLKGAVLQIQDSDTIIVSSSYAYPRIFQCPGGNKKCDILCMQSPPPSSLIGPVSASASCKDLVVIAGPIEEVKIVCEDYACPGLTVQSSAKKTNIECQGPGACLGAKFMCGLQSTNKFLWTPVPPTMEFIECTLTCTNGGCADSPARGKASKYVKGAYFKCTGRNVDCRIKANSQIQGQTYGPNQKTHRGSFTGGHLDCAVHPRFGRCTMECSDALGFNYCNNMQYNCRTPSKPVAEKMCRCTDVCRSNPQSCRPFDPAYIGDCVTAQLPTQAPTLGPSAKTDQPTNMPTKTTPKPSQSTSHPTTNPTKSTPKPTKTTPKPTKQTSNPTLSTTTTTTVLANTTVAGNTTKTVV